jgi:NADH-quinone oxidoreductase subunit L
VFVTALYTFRMLFLTFHGPERFRQVHEEHTQAGSETHQDPDAEHGHGEAPHESPLVVTLPLIALAIPSVIIGALTVGSVLFGSYFGTSIFVLPANNVIAKVGAEFSGATLAALHGFISAPFGLALVGAVTAWAFFLRWPQLADAAARRFGGLWRLLTHKYYFDWFNEHVLAALARGIGVGLWKGGDEVLIDGALVNGTADSVGWFGGVLRRVQSGYLYSYAFWMMIGLALLLGWFLAHA